MISYAIALYILMHESLFLNQILVSFNFLMFIVCGFRESMHVLGVYIVLSCLCELITAMINMILLSTLAWCLKFFFYIWHTYDYYLLLLLLLLFYFTIISLLFLLLSLFYFNDDFIIIIIVCYYWFILLLLFYLYYYFHFHYYFYFL